MKFLRFMGRLYTLQRRDRSVVLAKAATGTVVTNHGIVFRLNHRHQWEALYKAGRRRRVSPGQLDLFGGPKQGDTKVENGITYQLNANSRWERVDKDAPVSQEKAAEPAIVPVIEEQPAQGYKKLIQKAERMFGEELRAIDEQKQMQSEIDQLEKIYSEKEEELLEAEESDFYDRDRERQLGADLREIATRISEKRSQSHQKSFAAFDSIRSKITKNKDSAKIKQLVFETVVGGNTSSEPRIDYVAELRSLHAATKGQVVSIGKLSFDSDKADGRAYASPPNVDSDYKVIPGSGSIDMGSINNSDNPPSYCAEALWHEFGHHLEYCNTAFADAAMEWRDSRAYSDVPVKLSQIAGAKYRDDEIAFPGKYIDPYVGKVYSGYKHTEVISVGLQHFSSTSGMAYLHSFDKEHFLLILGMLS